MRVSGCERATDQAVRPFFCQVLRVPPTNSLAPAETALSQPGSAAKLAAAAFFVLCSVFVSERTRRDCWMFLRQAVIS